MDIFLALLGFLFIIIGLIGSFLPILPGPPMSWVGLLLLYLTKAVPNDTWFLVVTLVVALLVFALDYIIPALGTKKFGGSKMGMIGTTVGLLISIFFPIFGAFGIIIWPFIGALVGELINKADSQTAIKAAFGSFLGFLTGTFLKFIVAIVYLGFFIMTFWEYKASIFAF
ncbi:DUF456 domain-containing protein [Lacinutrix sp. C3R15]|uniref:DUF456 domain-containing protein n=1 Tax=Flavobacteriaceae TaxID=49546 RepID=UPI001C09D518|nr:MULTISPECIES: DUF456 domain-containing protein [Flavobacteriaceae]MBU2939081.1 DUF456 domain-containing protein [Lacinutrix sp. C3R15]MDO6622396.1 DUF456 domain-containing protein [Oceanihabitans sp. 1_MG-2023]